MLEPSVPDDINFQPLIKTATEAATQAGMLLLHYARDGFRITHKSLIDLVTEADHAAEQCVIDIILANFPDHRILAEERGEIDQSPSHYRWIIDPLDGTTNFAHGFPAYCVSIGLEIGRAHV